MAPMLSTALALLAVCALAVVSLRLLGRRAAGQPTRGLRVVARLPLDARRTLFVVEAAGRSLLVGAGDGPLTLLAELDPSRLPAPATTPAVSAAEALKRALGLAVASGE